MILLCLMVIIGGCGKSVEQQIAEQLELGRKYLEEQNYEEAILAFNKVIELEPKTLGAYKGKSTAYEMQGDYVYAVSTLEQGFELIGVEQLDSADVERLIELYTALISEEEIQGNIEMELEYYRKILEYQPENESAVKRYSEIETFNHYKEQIIEIMSSASEDDTVLLEETEILDEQFDESVKDLETPIFSRVKDNLYIGVYPQGYIYYGEMKSGKREGTGLWYSRIDFSNSDSSLTSVFSGIWIDDLPNGRGYYKRAIDNKIDTQISGSYKDGLFNGTMELQSEDTVFGYGLMTYKFNAENGHIQVIGYNHVNQQIIARINEKHYLVNTLETGEMGIPPFGELPWLTFYYQE